MLNKVYTALPPASRRSLGHFSYQEALTTSVANSILAPLRSEVGRPKVSTMSSSVLATLIASLEVHGNARKNCEDSSLGITSISATTSVVPLISRSSSACHSTIITLYLAGSMNSSRMASNVLLLNVIGNRYPSCLIAVLQ